MKLFIRQCALFIFLLLRMSDLFAQTEYLVSIDTLNGNYTKIKSIPGVKWINVLPSYITFDENNGVYFFKGDDANNIQCIYSIEATTGNILSKPAFPVFPDPKDNLLEFQYDNVTGKLYGLHWNNAKKTEFLVSIDPLAGTFTIIDSIPGVKWIRTNNFTIFDEKNHLYMFSGSPNTVDWYLYSVNVLTGKVVSKPKYLNFTDPKDNISDFKFNNTTHKLYGLHWDDSEKRESLVTLDSGTAKMTIVDSLPGVKWIHTTPNYTTIDEKRNHLFFRGGGSAGDWYLYTVDLATGKIIRKFPFPKLCNPKDNVIELHFDKVTDKLYGLHWDAGAYNLKKLRDTTTCPNRALIYDLPAATKWSNGDSGNVLRPQKTGYYSYISKKICDTATFRDTVFITLKKSPAYLPRDTFFCTGTSIVIGTNIFFPSVRWNTGSYSHGILVSVPGTYIRTISDFDLCRYIDTCKVHTFPYHKPDLGKDTGICKDETFGQLTGHQYPFIKYVWNQLDTSATTLIVPKTSGNYTLAAQDSNLCWSSDTINLKLLSPQKPVLGNDRSFCRNDSLQLYPKNSYQFLKMRWNTGDSIYLLSIKKKGEYIITTTDSNSCIQSDTINIGQYPFNKPYLGPDISICLNQGKDLRNLTSYKFKTFLWSDGSTKETLFIKSGNTFTLRVTDLNNCPSADTVTIQSKPLPVFTLGPDKVLCEGDSNTISIHVNGATYQWDDGSTDSSKTFRSKGNYILSVTLNGCTLNDTFGLNVLDFPAVELGPEQFLCGIKPVLLDAGPASSYLWNTGETTRQISIKESGVFHVKASNGECTTSDSVMVHPQHLLPIYMPSAFSPNNDGHNDVFDIVTRLEISEISIYNRWGQQIHKSIQSPFTWDGTFQGEPCQVGAYMVIAKHIGCDGSQILTSHILYLMR